MNRITVGSMLNSNKSECARKIVQNQKCEFCRKTFTFKQSLLTHLRYVHADILMDQKFKCTECPIKARTLLGLKEHVRIHTGEKPHICLTCGLQFRTKRAFCEHSKTHK